MANSLHISYDLKEPGKNYEQVISAVKRLGVWAKVHYSFWYVGSQMSAEQARDFMLKSLDTNDSLYVVDATNNLAAWYNVSDEVARFIESRWLLRAA